MGTKIELQPRLEQHLARWEELGADPKLAKLPYKIETDRLGRILISPPPFFDHTRHLAMIIKLLHVHLPAGKVLPETPVVTSDGVKVTDAANGIWREPDKIKRSEFKRTWVRLGEEEGETALGLDGEKVLSPKFNPS